MRILSLVKRIAQQMVRDKRTLALMMVAPLLILTLMHFLFTLDSPEPRIGVIGADDALTRQLEDDMKVKEYSDGADIKQTMIDEKLDAMLQINGNDIEFTVLNDDPSAAKGLQIKVKQVIAAQASAKQAEVMKNLPVPGIETPQAPEIKTAYIYGNEDTTFFDILSPILVGFFVFFFVFLISGISLLRERTTGTLERLLATPIKRHEIVFGYLIGYGFFAVIQTFIVVFYAVKVLDIVLVGSVWNVVLINLLLALVALSLGILLSAFAHSEFQMMQFIPIAIIPQVFFAGILPVDNMDQWLQVIAKLMPMYYGGDALAEVMYKGSGLGDIASQLFTLFGFALLFIVLNIFALKKYRKI
ncbi:ABC transporter permease [Bacillus benzoevorans]|uniref:ABC-2 type transport system permease protein n=1 Tax=Bacillus benzoevorans TaxID=1456 RepID=A0A7X0HTN1_9BACI|nr:ABC transporter permease [Bacillus benzoevorans]MBB6445505.1 ABC-2 type transport system permease protein [Bacillus benzoevorans]